MATGTARRVKLLIGDKMTEIKASEGEALILLIARDKLLAAVSSSF